MNKGYLTRFFALGLAVLVFGGCNAGQAPPLGPSASTTEEELAGPLPPLTRAEETAYPHSIRALEESMEQSMKDYGTHAAIVVLMEDGEIIYQQSFGQANNSGAPVTENTLFNIGSVSKLYVTAAILDLVQDGKLALDDPVAQHIPEFRMADERYRDITVKMLLNHTSGLPGGNIDNWFLSGSDTYPDSTAVLLDTLQGETLKAVPGEYAVYCNEGFILAAEVVASVSGMPYEGYLQSELLGPMGLTATTISSSPLLNDDGFARLYDAGGNSLPREIVINGLNGSGAVASTGREAALFGDRILREDGGLFDAETVAMFRELQDSTKLGAYNQFNSIGWDSACYNFGGLNVYSKSGGTTQYLTQLVTAPDERITIVGITTTPSAVNAQMEWFMSEVLTEKGAIRAGDPLPAPPPEAAIGPNTAALAGKYSLIGGALLVDVRIEGNQLYLIPHLTSTLPGQDGSIPYQYREDGGFWSAQADNGAYEVLSFEEVDGNLFLMQEVRSPVYSYKLAIAQGLKAAQADPAWTALDSSLWLRENLKYNSLSGMADMVVSLTVDQEQPGYLMFLRGTPFRITGSNTADSVAETARDSGRLLLEDGVLDYRGIKFKNIGTAASLPVGERQKIELPGDNHPTWLRATEPARLTPVSMGGDTRLLILNLAGEVLYDNFLHSGPVELAADSLVLLTSGTPAKVEFEVEPVSN